MLESEYHNFFAKEERLRLRMFQWIPEGSLKLLDLGCKKGNITNRYLEKAKCVTGLDIDLDSVITAKKNYPDIDFVAGRIEELPFSCSSFNVVLMSEVLQYLSTPEKCVEEMFRVLKPNGTLILSVPQKGVFYQYLNPGYVRRVFVDRKSSFVRKTNKSYFYLPDLTHLLEERFVLEEVYRGGSLLYPYLSKILEIIIKWPKYPESNRDTFFFRRIYVNLSNLFFYASSRLIKSIMQADHYVKLGKYSFNIVLRARRKTE